MRAPHVGTATTAKAAADSAVYVNESECALCHGTIAKSCAGSNHIKTLRAATRSSLGALAPPEGEISSMGYRVRADGERLSFAASEGASAERTMDYALGSGKLGMTYVSMDDSSTLTELRMSWYPSRKTWYVTPGQESDTDNHPGNRNDAAISRKCMGCHATTLPADSIRPEPRFFGVGCQACHGPASEHLAAAKAGRFADLRIERISSWSPSRINDMCGTCHRRASDIVGAGDEVTMTQRFQPYGIAQSPCFQKSGGMLSCITCHDPHKNTSRDQGHYEAACLKCHGPAHAVQTPAPTGETAGKQCPVNLRSGCIPCHMPKRKVFVFSQIPINMADHMIWAYGKKHQADAGQ